MNQIMREALERIAKTTLHLDLLDPKGPVPPQCYSLPASSLAYALQQAYLEGIKAGMKNHGA